jgi:spore maturation protein CgeB
LREFLIEPAQALGLRTTVHGVRFPPQALQELESAGLTYQGWLPNYRVPEVFARHRVTIHVPRRPYVAALPGIPTIRPFEALACGIPLISAPWPDDEHLFRPGEDYLVARSGAEMRSHLADVLNDAGLAARLAASGLETIRARHTCAHRVDELMGVIASVAPATAAAPVMSL